MSEVLSWPITQHNPLLCWHLHQSCRDSKSIILVKSPKYDGCILSCPVKSFAILAHCRTRRNHTKYLLTNCCSIPYMLYVGILDSQDVLPLILTNVLQASALAANSFSRSTFGLYFFSRCIEYRTDCGLQRQHFPYSECRCTNVRNMVVSIPEEAVSSQKSRTWLPMGIISACVYRPCNHSLS